MEMIAIEGRLMPASGRSEVPPTGVVIGVGDPLGLELAEGEALGEGEDDPPSPVGFGEASGVGEGDRLIPEDGKLVEERMVSVAGEG